MSAGHGFVDLHVHLIPGVDDGAKTIDDSLAMIAALKTAGFSEAAPSPHNRPEYSPKDVCLARLEEVRARLQADGIAFELHENSENFFLDPKLVESLRKSEARKLGSVGAYVLVEAPYTTPLVTLPEIIFRMKLKGVTPLIAHPERCIEFERKGRAAEAVSKGAHLQLDIGALLGRYGRTAEKLARQFLDDGLYAVAASDLHSPIGAGWVAESVAALEKGWGVQVRDLLLKDNPRALLSGAEPVVHGGRL